MQSRSLHFAESVRALSATARGLGLDVPAIRSRPRRADLDRSLRRRSDGQVVVSVRLDERPFAAVQADLVEAFVVVNEFVGADAALLRRSLWQSLEVDGLLGPTEAPIAPSRTSLDVVAAA